MRIQVNRSTSATARKPERVAALRIGGIGRVLMWQGGSLWIGRQAGHAVPHAHHGIQISLALDGPDAGLLLRSGDSNEWSEFRAAIVMPNRRHEFDGLGGSVAQIFVEPETAHGRTLLDRYGGADITALPPEMIEAAANLLRTRFLEGADDLALIATARRAVEALAGALPARTLENPRIAEAIEFMSKRVRSTILLQDVAAAVHLSPSRLRHLFVQETGITFRGYILWLRINHAVAAMMGGQTWTQAAQESGFSDSAHLSRTFRRMFGINPAMLIKE